MRIAYREVATRPYYLHRELFGHAFVEMARTLGGALAPASIADLVDRQYRATLDTAMLRDDCVATLRNLRAKGIRVQIVSNIDDDQMDALAARLVLAPEVDAWTSSESARSCKPDARIYQVALEVAGCAPRRRAVRGRQPRPRRRRAAGAGHGDRAARRRRADRARRTVPRTS